MTLKSLVLWLLVSLAPSIAMAGEGALQLSKGTEILEKWTKDQHVYQVGNLGLEDAALAGLEEWIEVNAPNWTVLLMESSAGEKYRDVFGTDFHGIDAVEHAMGKGLPASTVFGALKDAESGLANGAFFILFLKDRNFSYYGDQAYQRYWLGEKQWKGNLDRPAINAMRNGGRVIDAARDTIQSIDERYRKAVIAEKERALKNMEQAAEGMEKVSALMMQAGKEFESFWNGVEKPGKGAFAVSPLDEWQVDFERLKRYRLDGHTQLQLGGLSLLEKKVMQWQRDFLQFSGDQLRLARLREQVDALNSVDMTPAMMTKAEEEYRDGDPAYRASMSEVQVGIANFQRREEEIRSRQKMFGVAGVSGLGFLGLMGVAGNRRRRRIKLEAETLLEKRQEEMKGMVERLFKMMDRAAIVVGPAEELASRGYSGETLRLSKEALHKIDEAFVLSSNVQRILEEASELIAPGNPLSRSRNLVSGGRYENAVDLLDAEIRTEAKIVPSLGDRERPGGSDDQVMKVPIDEWVGRTSSALDAAEGSLNEVDEAWTTIVSRRENLEKMIGELWRSRPERGDEWFHVETTFDEWIPSMQKALGEGAAMGANDPVRALRGPFEEGDRMANEGQMLLKAIATFRRNHWAGIEDAEEKLHARNRSTAWLDDVLGQLDDRSDEIAREGGSCSVADKIKALEKDCYELAERVKTSVDLAARADEVSLPTLKTSGELVTRVRRELASVLKLSDDQLLIEEGRNPSVYLTEARLQLDGALAALDLGSVAQAGKFLEEVAALVSKVEFLVGESKRSYDAYSEMSEELWTLRGKLERKVKKSNLRVEAMRSRYSPSALMVVPGEISGGSYHDAPTNLEGSLVGIVKRLELAKSLRVEGKLLESWDALLEGQESALAGEELCVEIISRQEQLESLEASNASALRDCLAEEVDLGRLVSDRRVTRMTLVEFRSLGAKLREAVQLVEAPEGRIEPFLAEDLLKEIGHRIPAIQKAITDDLAQHGDAVRLLETVKVALESAQSLSETAETDRIPDSEETTVSLRQIESRTRELDEVGRALGSDHGDWRQVQERLRAIHLGLSEATMALGKELELARDAVRFLESGATEVNRAAGWSGSYGVRINGRPGGQALDRANGMMMRGQYQAAMEWAGRARSEARSAVSSAEAEESARARAEQQRRDDLARAARRSRMSTSGFSSSGGSSFGSRSSGGSSSSGSRRSGGGSSVGRSSFSSGSGVGRSGW